MPLTTTHAFPEQARRLSQAVLNLLFPPRCLGCRRPGLLLCRGCVAAFPLLDGALCVVCSTPLLQPGTCARCASQRPAFQKVTSAFRYTGLVRRAILALKYSNRPGLASPLAVALAGMVERPGEGAALCAVPMHAEREAARGYNHAALLAAELARCWGLPLMPGEALTRLIATPSQVQLDYEGRLANVQGAFSAQASTVRGQTIVLIDDICTTGATLNACAEELLAAGTLAVSAITLARAQ